MKTMNFINSSVKISLFLLLFLFGLQQNYGQERKDKINSIIDSLRIVETQKWALIEMKIKPLKYEVSKEDSLKIIKIENLLTDEEIKRRIILSFEDVLTDVEINDLYNFTLSTVFYKFFKSSLINNSLTNEFKDIINELDIIADSYENKDKNILKFEPIPIDREDGFYAIIDNKLDSDKDITLEKSPAITKEDILEIKRSIDNNIDITLKKDGTQKFYLLTKNNIGKPIAIVIDKYIVSMPVINSIISEGKVSIGGNFTEEEVENIISKWNSK
jgi:hypothetical protein